MIDLRSDTVTRPTPEMRAAMAAAEVGDDCYGEDPTINELEARTAELLGQEAGLFCPSGTMSNLLGIWSLVPRGQEVLCDAQCHLMRAELGSHAALHGITSRTWTSPFGVTSAAQIAELLSPPSQFLLTTGAVALENTHNFGGGTVQPLEVLQQISALCETNHVGRHLDGARLWNAHVATGIPMATYGKLFDTISICFSKGLGAPVGSVLVSSAQRIARARQQRRALGGGMRQAGVLAAAALYALDHNVERLVDDHAGAAELHRRIAEQCPDAVPHAPETNIVVIRTGERSADEVVAAASQRGVRISVVGAHVVRAVTHLGVSFADCTTAGNQIGAVLA